MIKDINPHQMKIILAGYTTNPCRVMYEAWVVSRSEDMPTHCSYSSDCHLAHTPHYDESSTEKTLWEEFLKKHEKEFPYESTLKMILSMEIPVLEMVHFTLCIKDIPLSLREQLVRHGKFISFWMQTSRVRSMANFVDDGHFRLPPIFNKPENAHLKEKYLNSLKISQDTYRELTEAGIPREEARDIIPAYSHNMYMCMSLRSIKTLLRSRTCFTGDTKIPLLNGEIKQLKDMSVNASFWVHSLDSKGEVKAGRATNLGITRQKSILVKVTLDNGKSIRCTPDHLFMLRNGSYMEAQYLVDGESLMPLYRKMINVVSVDFLNEAEEVYDITVDDYHNFAIDAGVFVHNCQIAQPSLWAPFISQIVAILKWVDPLLMYAIPGPPCVKGDKFVSCPVEADNIRRLDKNLDPAPPCSLWYNKVYVPNKTEYREKHNAPAQDNFSGEDQKELASTYGKIWDRDPLTYEPKDK